ncbi:HesA/MoeB/ThiF family protein [Propionivibrio dicarboxylicus]|uniref:ThiF family protein n=1 Tax=Propionivibrio dicarboxylicus TaxID=83767 RepID=A0A1G8NWD0_9RHOO|nr:ThiF family adenylyltransferase [Propionivibrio dicarboxylicus]SDI84591.1 ThiF family protein [Propionivibrio dicarboxylicus]
MKLSIRIAAPVMERLRRYHLAAGKHAEALSYVWARAVERKGEILVLVPHNAPLKLFAPDCFVRQTAGNVQLCPDVLNGMLIGFAASDFNCLINVHDHWFDETTTFSSTDDRDDLVFDRYLRRSFEPMLLQHPHIGPVRRIHNLSLVLAQKGVEARLVNTRSKRRFLKATKFSVIGEQFERPVIGIRGNASVADDMFTRQKDFITPDKQDMLANLSVALVGCGGLGSILAESLARCGVGSMLLIDDDELSLSNLNRWQGGCHKDIGQPKSKILAANLKRMFPALCVSALVSSLYATEAEQFLVGADIVVAGVDNDEARYFLNRLCLQYQIPYFDAGVDVTIEPDSPDFRARFFAIVPGVTACLECTQIELYQRQKTLDAYQDVVTAEARRNAGYVTEQPEISAPNVYAINQRSASLLGMELLNYICGWQPMATSILESWKSGIHERLSRKVFPEPPHPSCPICGYYAGVGDAEKLPRPRAFALAALQHLDGCIDVGSLSANASL